MDSNEMTPGKELAGCGGEFLHRHLADCFPGRKAPADCMSVEGKRGRLETAQWGGGAG